jgi:hypothetical protein
MIKVTAVSITFFTFLASALLYKLFGLDYVMSTLSGGAFMVLNLAGLYILWKLIFSKKSIALAVLVIIFKYSILGYFLWILPQLQWLKPTGFIVGLSTLIFGIFTAMILKKYFQKNI